MLLQAAIEIANAERWALEIGDRPAPLALKPTLRRSAYEVTVVDVLHRVARRYFERSGSLAVWERSFATGARGRPEAVDIALFDASNSKETRVELGLYTKAKLKADATKLARLGSTTIRGYRTTENLLLLWEVNDDKLTRSTSRDAMRRFKADVAAAFAAAGAPSVAPLIASSVDLFVAASGTSRLATAGLFQVT